MATTDRRKFGGTAADWVFSTSGGTLSISAAATVQFYTALSGGTRVTDLQTTGGAAITSITTDSNGEIGEFLGSPGAYRLAADANAGAGPRRWVIAQDLGNGVGLSMLDYGADPSGGSDDTTAFRNATADALAAGGLRIRIPAGTYNCNGGHINWAPGLWFDGDGYNCTQINCNYSGAAPNYLFNMDPPPPASTSTTPLENPMLTGVELNVTNADIFWGWNAIRGWFVNNFFQQNSTGFSVANVSQSTGSGGNTYMSENVFANREMSSGTRTVEMWFLDFSGSGKRANDNIWEKGPGKIWTRPGSYWLRMIGDATVLGSKHNTWRDLVFEASGGTGGHLWLQNTSEFVIDNVSMEDLGAGTVSNPIIKLNAYTTGPGCRGGVISHYSRRSGDNISNTLPDLLLDSNCQGITVTSPSQSSGGTALTMNFGSATNCVRNGAWYSQSGAPVILNATGVNAYV